MATLRTSPPVKKVSQRVLCSFWSELTGKTTIQKRAAQEPSAALAAFPGCSSPGIQAPAPFSPLFVSKRAGAKIKHTKSDASGGKGGEATQAKHLESGLPQRFNPRSSGQITAAFL
jgi:hypothetical protein